MLPFTNNIGTFGMSSGWGDDQERSEHYPVTPQQQNVPDDRILSRNDLHGASRSRRLGESYTTACFSPNTSSWSSNALVESSFCRHGGVWHGDRCLDGSHPGALISTREGNTVGSEVNLFTGMSVAAPLEQVIPVMPGVLPTPHAPSPNQTEAHGLTWQHASSWYHPVHAPREHGEHGSSVDSHGMRTQVPSIQSPASAVVIPGHSGRSFFQTDRFHPNSAQFAAARDPVPNFASTSRSRGGERRDSLNATTFQCMWISRGRQCLGQIAGDRSSVTCHLRDEHNFTCDGEMIACLWAGCTAQMQRRNLPRHIVACHFAIKVPCPGCGLELSRVDASKKHQLACPGAKLLAPVKQGEGDADGYF